MIEGALDEELDHGFGEIHVVVEVAERHFGFDHPEFGGVARGVGIFGAEGGSEGVDLAEGAGEGFAFELARDGEVGGFAEEIVVPLGGFGLGGVEGGDAEHFAGAFAVAGGDDGCVDVVEISLAEEVVDGVAHGAAQAEHGAIEIGARAEVSDGAEEFGAVAFFLEWVIGGGGAEEGNFSRVEFPRLGGALGGEPFAVDGDGGAGGHLREMLGAGRACVDDDLEVLEAGAVVEFEEGECFIVAASAHPARDAGGGVGLIGLEPFADGFAHGLRKAQSVVGGKRENAWAA